MSIDDKLFTPEWKIQLTPCFLHPLLPLPSNRFRISWTSWFWLSWGRTILWISARIFIVSWHQWEPIFSFMNVIKSLVSSFARTSPITTLLFTTCCLSTLTFLSLRIRFTSHSPVFPSPYRAYYRIHCGPYWGICLSRNERDPKSNLQYGDAFHWNLVHCFLSLIDSEDFFFS